MPSYPTHPTAAHVAVIRWKSVVHRYPDGAQGGEQNKMKPTNPNAHTYVNGTDVNTHGYAVTHNTFLQ